MKEEEMEEGGENVKRRGRVPLGMIMPEFPLESSFIIIS